MSGYRSRTVLHDPKCEFLRPDGIACTCGSFEREIAAAKLARTATTTTDPEEPAVPDVDATDAAPDDTSKAMGHAIADAEQRRAEREFCTCPADCPVHRTKPKTAACPNDTHSLGCHCDKGGPIELDVPPLTGLSAREQYLDLCGELPPEVKQGRLKARMDALVKMASENQTTGQRAGAICATAADLVNNDRNAIYGDAEQNFTETGALWAVVFGHEVTAEQVAICMALVKVARLIKTPNHADSWTDGVGYLALGGGIASKPGRYV
ncbi:hypothetical protein SEA_WALELIANO_52 [Mycobacterium phage Waleliano]|uniref:DUF6378 domain-containing protein n=2 Tax=Coopervirus brownCNA TaxID=1983108 RepID=A0A0K1Y6Q3_9CAUD|nr:hypothetical protein AVV09_gp54 [Mycobacterium phage BrownCNA]AKY02767.1 hypothetical protein SEA_BROWNCNA_54 [Mycobacterium phage BrownCNA]QBI96121.1 hypothetical protein SEA_WALELIANO_52 [Mycobacterium phage Waleliano]